MLKSVIFASVVTLLAFGTQTFVAGKPLDDYSGVSQYDGANEYNLGQFGASASDESSSGAVIDDDNVNEYGDYPNAAYSSDQGALRRSDDDLTEVVRVVRNTQQEVQDLQSEDRSAVKISLSDLVGAVEHTLVHSAQNLAIVNNSEAVGFNSTETSTIIALPIEVSTRTPATVTPESEPQYTASTTSNVEVGHLIKPHESLNLLSVIAASSSRPLTTIDDAEKEISATTFSSATSAETTTLPALINIHESNDAVGNVNNITIIQTINSTVIHPVAESDDGSVSRVQLQHITLFSAGAGVFPDIHAVNLDTVDSLTLSNPKSAESSESPESSESTESTEKRSACGDKGSSGESIDSETAKCHSESATKEATTSTTTAKTIESNEEKAKEILKEKIAEVEAEPVILTQGI